MVRDLYIGCKGADVKELQSFLKSRGFYVRQVDGDFGKYTRSAVMLFQKKAGIIVDGYVGAQTRAAIQKIVMGVPGKDTKIAVSDWITVADYTPDKQDTSYTCGPASLASGFSELNIHISEQEFAKAAGTVYKLGTSHAGLEKAVRYAQAKYCVTLKYWWVNWGSIGPEGIAQIIKDPKMFSIGHGSTGGWKKYWIGDFGHYVYVIAINLKDKLIRFYDPTKGVVQYSFAEAKLGFDMKQQDDFLVVQIV